MSELDNINLPLISVIVPVYNVEEYLPRCLDSLLGQTHRELEIILINDGSTDKSGNICEYYKKLDPRVKVIHQENAGISAARNAGMDIMKGQWIGFVDSDDYIDLKMYEKLLKAAIEQEKLIAFCGHVEYTLDGDEIHFVHPELAPVLSSSQFIEHEVYKEKIAMVYTKLYHRSLIEGDIKERLDTACYRGADLIYKLKMVLKVDELVYLPEPLYKYERRKESITTSGITDKSMSRFNAHQQVIALLMTVSQKLARFEQLKFTECAVRWLRRTYDDENLARFRPELRRYTGQYAFSYILSKNVKLKDKIKFFAVMLLPRLTHPLWVRVLNTDTSQKTSNDALVYDGELISVIVPVYNIEKYVRRCVESIIGQSYKNLEIILVNDSSTDSCAEICAELAAKDDRIKLIHHKENGGLSVSRNTGLEHSSGNTVAFIDGDDYIVNDYIARLYGLMIEYDADITITSFVKEYEKSGKRKPEKKEPPYTVVFEKHETMEAYLYRRHYMTAAWGRLFRRELFDGIRFPSGMYAQDFAIFYKLIDKAGRMVYRASPDYIYYQNPSSIIRTKQMERERDNIKIIKEMSAFIDENYPHLKDACIYRCFSTNIHILIDIPLGEIYQKKHGDIIKSIKEFRKSVIRNQKARLVYKGCAYFSYFGIWTLKIMLKITSFCRV